MSKTAPLITWELEEDTQAMMRAAVKYSEKFTHAPKTSLFKLDVKRVAKTLQDALEDILQNTILEAFQGALLNTTIVQDNAESMVQSYNRALGDGLSDGRIFHPGTYSPRAKADIKEDDNPDFLKIGKFYVKSLGPDKIDVTSIVYRALRISGLDTEAISSDGFIYVEQSSLEEVGYIIDGKKATLKPDTPEELTEHKKVMLAIQERRLTF